VDHDIEKGEYVPQEEFERERKRRMAFLQLLSRFGEKENKAK